MKRYDLALICLMILSISAVQATARSHPLGVRGGLSFEPDQAFIGIHTQLEKPSPDWVLIPSAEIGFGNDVTLFSLALAGRYLIHGHNMADFKPFVGGEAGFNSYHFDNGNFSSTNTELALGVLGGLEKRLDQRRNLFFEIRLGLTDYAPDIKLAVGLTFF
jgi:hypothetical protein